MDHEQMIKDKFDALDGGRFFGVWITGYKISIDYMRTKRRYGFIMKCTLYRDFWALAYWFCFTVDQKLKTEKKMFYYEIRRNIAISYTFGITTKIKYVLQVLKDLILRDCKYKMINGKKFLVYKDIKKLRF